MGKTEYSDDPIFVENKNGTLFRVRDSSKFVNWGMANDYMKYINFIGFTVKDGFIRPCYRTDQKDLKGEILTPKGL